MHDVRLEGRHNAMISTIFVVFYFTTEVDRLSGREIEFAVEYE